MKRWISAILAGMMLTSALAACSDAPAEDTAQDTSAADTTTVVTEPPVTEKVYIRDIRKFDGKAFNVVADLEPGNGLDYVDLTIAEENGEALNEPYAINIEKSDYDITLPCTVPQGRVFVLGDNREYSADSRNEAIGCIPEEQIIGRALIRIWPLDTFGILLPDEQSAEG